MVLGSGFLGRRFGADGALGPVAAVLTLTLALLGGVGAGAAVPVAAGGAPGGVGSISVTPYACPDGMRPETLDPSACSRDPEVMELLTQVLYSGDNRRTLADAERAGDTFVWEGLPYGNYVVKATDLASGYDRYKVPNLGGLNERQAPPEKGYTVSPNEGHLVPLGAAMPRYDLDVFAFRAADPDLAGDPFTFGLFVARCAPGVVAALDMTGADCRYGVDVLASGVEVAIGSDRLGYPLRLEGSGAGDAGARIWDNVPLGEYAFTATLPPGVDGYALRPVGGRVQVRLRPDGTGYTFRVDEPLFEPDSYRRVNLTVYLLTN